MLKNIKIGIARNIKEVNNLLTTTTYNKSKLEIIYLEK